MKTCRRITDFSYAIDDSNPTTGITCQWTEHHDGDRVIIRREQLYPDGQEPDPRDFITIHGSGTFTLDS